MEPYVLTFNWIEYSVFGFMLGISALIGVYFGFFKGGQNTVDGYFLGGKQMGVVPISMSLTSSFISGITILGIPTEIYSYGTQYMVAILCFFTVGIICAYVFLPVFYKLQVISVYEYMELRFNRKVRKLVSFLYTFSLFTYIPVVIYGPALALNQVSGINIHQMALLVCLVCIFYTTFGGLRAVVWTDALQGGVMVIATVIVAIIGTVKVGGLSAIFQAASDGDRLHIFDMNIDPTQRVTFWTIVIGQTVAWTGGSTISPSAIQRFVSLSTMEKARKSVFYFTFGCFIFFFLSSFMGLVIYARYKDCDPKASGMIQSSDQILPFFILDVTGNVMGLPGLFLAGVVCAALSTMSTGLNTVSGTLYEDFIEPIFGKTTEYRASLIMKILVVIFGGICLALVLVIEKLGNLVELGSALGGVTCGSILGIFVLGMFFPQANSMGSLVGGVCSLFTMSCILINSRSALARGDIVYPTKPISVDGCSFNVTLTKSLEEMMLPVSGKVFPLFEMSVFYYATFGSLVTLIVGLIVSYVTGPNKISDVDRRLLSPVIHGLLPEYTTVATKEVDEVRNKEKEATGEKNIKEINSNINGVC